jgi:hypothetical protein
LGPKPLQHVWVRPGPAVLRRDVGVEQITVHTTTHKSSGRPVDGFRSNSRFSPCSGAKSSSIVIGAISEESSFTCSTEACDARAQRTTSAASSKAPLWTRCRMTASTAGSVIEIVTVNYLQFHVSRNCMNMLKLHRIRSPLPADAFQHRIQKPASIEERSEER